MRIKKLLGLSCLGSDRGKELRRRIVVGVDWGKRWRDQFIQVLGKISGWECAEIVEFFNLNPM